jgi:hypothetical protein
MAIEYRLTVRELINNLPIRLWRQFLVVPIAVPPPRPQQFNALPSQFNSRRRFVFRFTKTTPWHARETKRDSKLTFN